MHNVKTSAILLLRARKPAALNDAQALTESLRWPCLQADVDRIAAQCEHRCVERVAVDLQRRLGRDEACDKSIYADVQPLLWDLGKFSCAKTVHEKKSIHCAGNVAQVRKLFACGQCFVTMPAVCAHDEGSAAPVIATYWLRPRSIAAPKTCTGAVRP